MGNLKKTLKKTSSSERWKFNLKLVKLGKSGTTGSKNIKNQTTHLRKHSALCTVLDICAIDTFWLAQRKLCRFITSPVTDANVEFERCDLGFTYLHSIGHLEVLLLL